MRRLIINTVVMSVLVVSMVGCTQKAVAPTPTPAPVVIDTSSLPPNERPSQVALVLLASKDVNTNVLSTKDESHVYLKGKNKRELRDKLNAVLMELNDKSSTSKKAQQAMTLANNVPDMVSGSTPIAFKVVQLRDDSLLLSADYQSIQDDLQGSLGQNYVSHEDYVLVPGQFKFVDFIDINPKTRFIAIIADYNDIENATWKVVIKVDSKGSKYPLYVQLRKSDIVIRKEGL
jgi:type VI secretion system VasD/TssJ family lipoprotein